MKSGVILENVCSFMKTLGQKPKITGLILLWVLTMFSITMLSSCAVCANDCRVACRFYRSPHDKLFRLGFRLARTVL